jgi:hypothetical protein
LLDVARDVAETVSDVNTLFGSRTPILLEQVFFGG